MVGAYLKKYEDIFVKEQDRRCVKADEALQKWQKMFSVNERKRKEDFEVQQVQHTEVSEERERDQLLDFMANQHNRMKDFLSGETLREQAFVEQREKHSHQFATFLRQRKTGLQESHRRVLNDARNGHASRAREVSKDMVMIQGEFLNMMAVWEDAVRDDEWKREQRFNGASED